MDVPNREQVEARLARLISREMQAELNKLLELLGDPPDMNNVPQSYWNNGGKALREVIEPELSKIFITQAELLMAEVGVGVDWTMVNQNAVTFARSYGYEFVTGIVDKTRDVLQQAVGDFYSQGLNLGQLQELIAPSFGPTRAQMIAITETTRASVEGEKAFAEQLMKENPLFEMIGYWITERDTHVCWICELNDTMPVSEVGYPPEHPNCRCTVRYEMRAKND